MKKTKIYITEQELESMIAKSILSKVFGAISDDRQKKGTSSSSEKYKTSGDFTSLDLSKPVDLKAYKEIADKFINSRSSNLLGLRGEMFANAAKRAFDKYGKYVPVELAMAQLAVEGGFSKDQNSRPIRTKNPFNVGNVDSGKNIFHSSVQNGIDAYYDLISRNYLTDSKTASDLINNFVNKNGNRYASNKNYEDSVGKIANQVKSIAQPIYASLSKKLGTDVV